MTRNAIEPFLPDSAPRYTGLDIDQQHITLFQLISDTAAELSQPVYVVGGYVRDYYLDRLGVKEIPEVDLVTVGSGVRLAQKLSKKLEGCSLAVFKQFGTAQIKIPENSVSGESPVPQSELILEFVGARKESYRRDSRKPIVEDGTLEDDQRRRDFTINALYWSLNKEDFGVLLDPFGGIRDLKKRLIRTPVDPRVTFDDDPLRMLRAIRFAAHLNFKIAPETLDAIKEMAERITIVSKERIIDEVNKIVMADKPSIGFGLLFKTGLLNYFFPELSNLQGAEEINGIGHKDNFWHTLQVLDNISAKSDNLWLRWAAIMHDIAKPATKRFDEQQGWTFHGHDALGAKWTKRIFRRLGLPLDERMRYVSKLVRLHLRPIALANEEVTDSAIRRLIVEAGENLNDLMLLCRADITSKNDRKVRRYLKNFDNVEKKIHEVEEKDRLRNWQPPINGDEIMKAFDLKPSPVVGKIKKAIEEAILNGDVPNDHDEAYTYMLEHKDEWMD